MRKGLLLVLMMCPAALRAQDAPVEHPRHPWANFIRQVDPFYTAPPSSKIKRGLWKEEDQYGAVKYTKAEFEAMLAAGMTPADVQKLAPTVVEKDETTPADAIGADPLTLDQLPLPKEPGKSEKMPKAPGMAYADPEMKPAFKYQDGERAMPNNTVAEKGAPERMPAGPAIDSTPKTDDQNMALALAARTTPNAGLSGKGFAESMPAGAGLEYRDAPADPNAQKLGAHGMDLTLSKLYKGTQESFPSAGMGAAKDAPAAGNGPEAEWTELTHSAIPDIVALMEHGSPKLRARAADELGRRGDEAQSAIPALKRALSDAYAPVRASAVLAIGNIGGDKAALRLLVAPYLKDKNPDVYMSAQTALSRLK